MLMDLVSPLFPSAFIFIVCLGSISRSFTGVASGATRAALTQHFSLQNNAADISAKEGSQETLATMTGMLQSSGWKTECLLASSIAWKANWTFGPSDDKNK
ncbi:hypothetical protein IFM89_003078 [Coptis chinensis]|uniref:Protein root UVB sensitive/RUS domain-containing protein n=1 Tax=Coptis chinensis TaxID=261450 RepID=A0A835I8A5_9MAGN|nr:hypothetical protein IFM89_003078 [Coptis chinensis]